MRVVLTTYTVLIRDIEALSRDRVVRASCSTRRSSSRRRRRSSRGRRKSLRARDAAGADGTPIENRLDELWRPVRLRAPGPSRDARAVPGSASRLPIVRRRTAARFATLKQLIAPFKLRRVKKRGPARLPRRSRTRAARDDAAPAGALPRAVDRQAKELVEELKIRGRRWTTSASSRRSRSSSGSATSGAGAGRPADARPDERQVRALQGGARRGAAERPEVVVFTQYLEMMDLIEEHLRDLRVKYAEIRGDTKERARRARVPARDDVKVFVCSLLAGGMGSTDERERGDPLRPLVERREGGPGDRPGPPIGQLRGVQVVKLVTRGDARGEDRQDDHGEGRA